MCQFCLFRAAGRHSMEERNKGDLNSDIPSNGQQKATKSDTHCDPLME